MKSMILKPTILGTALLLAAAATTFAQQGPPKRRPSIEELFKHMDANKDGKLSIKEVKGPLAQDFAKIDLNEDGFITKE
jgi:Ca2+-binding EF-hand superfamily protein